MIWWTVWVDRLGSWVACWLVKGWMTSWASLASLTLVHVCNDLPRNRYEGRHLKSSDNVHSDPWCRDRYEGQLNEFLLENKNLKEQLTTLQVLCSKNEDTKSDKFQSQDVEGELAGAKEEVRGALGLKEELSSQLASAKAKQGSLETEVSRWTTKLNQVQFQDLRHDLGPNVWCFLPSSVMCFMQSRICLLQFISEFKRIFPFDSLACTTFSQTIPPHKELNFERLKRNKAIYFGIISDHLVNQPTFIILMSIAIKLKIYSCKHIL